MRKLHIIMPMAGEGSRFLKEGWITPKPLIQLHGKELFLRAIGSVSEKDIEMKYSFIVRQEHIDKYHIDEGIKKILPDANIFSVLKTTRGAVETCLMAESSIADNDAVIVMDCDLEFRSKRFIEIIKEELSQGTRDKGQEDIIDGGALVAFESNEPRYSYAALDENGNVVRTAEKEVISNYALCGAYFFSSGKNFKSIAHRLLDEPEFKKNEYYVSLLYNYLLADGARVRLAPMEEYHSYGTPEELKRYLQSSATTHKQDSKLVSIITPVYNAEKYLDDCVQSVLKQDYSHWELILVDDGSSDTSPSMCDAYVTRDVRIRVIHQENAGPGAARNKGMEAAKGDYLCFLDSDDYLTSNGISGLVAGALNFPEANYIKGDYVLSDKMNVADHICLRRYQYSNTVYTGPEFLHTIIHKHAYTIGTLYEVDYLRKYNITWPEGIFMNEDQVFTLRYCLYGHGVHIQHVAYVVRRDEQNINSLSNTMDYHKLLGMIKVIEYDKICVSMSNDSTYIKEANDWQWMIHCGSIALVRHVESAKRMEVLNAMRKSLGRIAMKKTSLKNTVYTSLYNYAPWLLTWLMNCISRK